MCQNFLEYQTYTFSVMSCLAVLFLALMIWFNALNTLALTLNPLNGKHLRTIWPRWSGNPKGLSGPLKGGVVLEYLAARFNFTYEMVRVAENRLEPPEKGKGLFSYLWDEQCDLLLQDVQPTFRRLQVVDMTLPWNYDYFSFLIPVHDEAANIDAVIKPFQWPVWIGLGISSVIVIVILFLIQRHLDDRDGLERDSTSNNGKNADSTRGHGQPGSQYLYVLGNLLSQSGPCTSRRLSFRLVAGVWTLAAFIFVQGYNSTLFTYVVAPVNQPLINSVYDIAESSDIVLLVKKAGTIDTLISNSNATGLYSKLRDRVNSFPHSRCTLVADCIRLVNPGSRKVFIDANIYHLDAIIEDFQSTKKCNLQLARDGFISIITTFALPKGSPFTKTISQGLLELHQTGLIDYWDIWFRPMPGQCIENIKSGYSMPKNKHPPLSLKNLTGAFLVLLIGLCLSFLAFLGEKVFFMTERRHQHRSRRLQKITAHVTESSRKTAQE
ncbi:glutamate [NMDA] receptor subunit 1-like [Daphnia magna]|uniref:glutamate [NMDA] receptor subunit 1 n=1 Tax=Daphnia magna TaxID=35525 RepID=UPI001E1BB6E8|nr:glutamate [NMDA] receptor subunit 1 [Daphnia magna]XP_045034774.1 glutamate [NMDA] receptor subunit 1-like [Daphnia magna]